LEIIFGHHILNIYLRHLFTKENLKWHILKVKWHSSDKRHTTSQHTHNHVISSSISRGTRSRPRFVQLICMSWHSQRGSSLEHANTTIKKNYII
jgi:hypothetical protein